MKYMVQYMLFIGVNLSESHTSCIAQVRVYVCLLACLLGPITYCKFQMRAIKYFTMIVHVSKPREQE